MIHLNNYKLRLHMTETKIIISLNTESIILSPDYMAKYGLSLLQYSLNLFIVQTTSLKISAIVFQFPTT